MITAKLKTTIPITIARPKWWVEDGDNIDDQTQNP